MNELESQIVKQYGRWEQAEITSQEFLTEIGNLQELEELRAEVIQSPQALLEVQRLDNLEESEYQREQREIEEEQIQEITSDEAEQKEAESNCERI